MSWASTITQGFSTPNQSPRMGQKVNGWIIHHNAATGGDAVLQMMITGSKSVSANYQVMQDGRVMGVVPRELRSWSASNALWDAQSLTFEIANNAGAPAWTISEAAYHSVAKTIAEDSRWAGIPINRTTVRGHREGSAQGAGGSYATACPGGIDLNRLVALAQHYASSATAGSDVKPINEKDDDEMKFLFSSGSNAGKGAVIAYANGYVSVLIGADHDAWNARCAALGKVPTDTPPRNADISVADAYLQSFLHVEAGLPMDWNLNAEPTWVRDDS